MPEFLTAPIVEWNATRNFGFLDLGRRRVFLHRKDFAALHKQPEIGDVIRFSIGADAQGRECAVKAVHFGQSSRRPAVANKEGKVRRDLPSKFHGLHADDAVFLALLLIAPGWALFRMETPLLVTLISAVALSAITFLIYLLDKTRAQTRDWRIPENVLHFLALIGGWPGAFLGQQHARHKTAKLSFQIVFWSIVFAWQFVAIDYLLDWKITLLIKGSLLRD